MNNKRSAISDARIDEIIGNLLRVGVIVSSLIVLVGGGLYLTRHGTNCRTTIFSMANLRNCAAFWQS